MSKPSPQQGGHSTPERAYIDLIPRTQHRAIHTPYPSQPRQILPQSTGYEHSTPTSLDPRPPALVPERNAEDPRYMLSSENPYMNLHPRPQVLPLRSHYQPPANHDGHDYYSPYDYSPYDYSPYDYSPYEERTIATLGQTTRDYDSHQIRTYDVESQHSSSSTPMPSPVWSDKSVTTHAFNPILPSIHQELKHQPRNANHRMPRGFDKLLHHEPESESPPAQLLHPRRPSNQSRYHLHIRQQPIAARACGAGDRDRRPVDPPPIVQILLTDFDPHSQDDRDLLQDPRFAVGCLLFPVSSSSPWAAKPTETGPQDRTHKREREGSRERERESDGIARTDDDFSTPLLSGKAFMSPFYVDADPDPNSAPSHPSSSLDLSSPQINNAASRLNQPAIFFIFADLSIRSAGLYRLQFRLMNWGSVEDTGQSMPILAEAWSDPFRVYPAKDFPGMRDSSLLAEGLKELGFVELKTRGNGKGKGKKRQ